MSVSRIGRFGVNAQLVEDDDGLTLVDTGMAFLVSRIRAAIEASGRPLTRIVITHAHDDHVGGLEQLLDAFPGVGFWISERDSKVLRGDRSPEPGEPADAKVRGGVPDLQLAPAGFLSDGDRVGSLEVIASPGHNPGHVSFLDTRDRTLIAGDAFSTLGGLATAAKPRLPFPVIALVAWHRPTALESARRLLELEPARLAVGHGRTLEDPVAAMRRAVARAG